MRRSMVYVVMACCGLAAALAPAAARAERPFLVTETASTLERGKSRVDVGLQYDRLERNVGEYTLAAELVSGLINNLQFEAEVPYIFLRSTRGGNESGLGDLQLKAKVAFLKGREANPLSIAGQLFVKFPSCNDSRALTPECTGESDVGLTAIASKEFAPIIVHLNLGVILVGNPPGQALDNVIRYSLAFEYESEVEGVRVFAELAGSTNRDPAADSDFLAVHGGIRFAVYRAVLADFGAGVGLTNAAPDYTVTGGLSYPF